MAENSEWATDLAVRLCNDVFYPRMADFVTKAITFCDNELLALDRDQVEQFYRAAFEAGDGVLADIAHGIDNASARRLVDSAQLGEFPFDPEVGR